MSARRGLNWFGPAAAGVSAVLLCAGGVAVLGHPRAPAALPRIGILVPNAEPLAPPLGIALRKLGYVDGVTISFESRYADGHDERLDGMAAELVAAGVNLIVAQNHAVRAARKATRTIPIVFVSVADPLSTGLVRSMAHPGGNITGIANMPLDLSLKRLEVIRDAFPAISRVAIVARSGNTNSRFQPERRAFAEGLGLEPRSYTIDSPDDYDASFSAMARDGMQAILLVQDSVFFTTRQLLMETALRHGLPVIGDSPEYAAAGAVLSYGVTSYTAIYERAAAYVDKILKGADPAELPVQQPMELTLAINLGVSRALGVGLSRATLLRANQVIE